MITKEMIEAVAWSPSPQEGMPWGMLLNDRAIENILNIGLANCAALTPSAGEAEPVAWADPQTIAELAEEEDAFPNPVLSTKKRGVFTVPLYTRPAKGDMR
ncbi:hypothetical protein ACFFP0_24860 [Rhizobium puerariae]|uniref:Uncharacterized protein n=1 Tax=Rhizobium puerariae TaxID=1585791 RepID=A0ABV6AQU5_9HYPH